MSSFRTMYLNEKEPLEIDKDWWWPDDVRKVSVAATGWIREKAAAEETKRRAKKARRG
jgi:hypothetical protein